MIFRLFMLIITALGLSPMVRAQNGQGNDPIQIRAVLHDPARAAVDLFIPDHAGNVVKLDMRPANLSNMQITRPVNGMVLFYNTGSIDARKPMENLAAKLNVPQNVDRVIVILVPNPPGSELAMHAILIDDTAKGFPKGESRVLSLVAVETAIQAGEHKLQVLPGKVTRVPSVTKRNEFNMAQTNFYYRKDGSWAVFTERQVQFLDAFRRVFIISAIPGSSHPYISTIVDTAVPPAPAKP